MQNSLEDFRETWLQAGGNRAVLSGYPDSFLQSLIWDLNAYNIDEADPEEQQLFKTCLPAHSEDVPSV